MFAQARVFATTVAPRAKHAQKVNTTTRGAASDNWFPGSTRPAYLDGSSPCDYGFDPLKLGEKPENLERYREAELIHGRWAMMGVAGVIGVEVAGQGTWVTAQPTSWEQTAKYMGMETHANLFAVIGTNLLLVAFAESSRGAAKGTDRMYPGGKFDPLGWSKGAEFETLKRKEIANGRVAMLAFLGVMSENQACPGLGPVEALKEHIASPWTVSAATNANAVPFL